jgi:hypothetical protein
LSRDFPSFAKDVIIAFVTEYKMKQLLLAVITLLLFFSMQNSLRADDFDDGISKSTDDAISADDELGKASKNIKFIIEKSKSQAKVAEKGSGSGKSKTKTGDSNENSVVMGAGSNVHGDIIIIDQGKK